MDIGIAVAIHFVIRYGTVRYSMYIMYSMYTLCTVSTYARMYLGHSTWYLICVPMHPCAFIFIRHPSVSPICFHAFPLRIKVSMSNIPFVRKIK